MPASEGPSTFLPASSEWQTWHLRKTSLPATGSPPLTAAALAGVTAAVGDEGAGDEAVFADGGLAGGVVAGPVLAAEWSCAGGAAFCVSRAAVLGAAAEGVGGGAGVTVPALFAELEGGLEAGAVDPPGAAGGLASGLASVLASVLACCDEFVCFACSVFELPSGGCAAARYKPPAIKPHPIIARYQSLSLPIAPHALRLIRRDDHIFRLLQLIHVKKGRCKPARRKIR